MSKFKTAVWDFDYIRYAVGFASEKRSIKVVHKQSGDEWDFKSRTEFYGRTRAKDGGALAEINKSRDIPYVLDEFEILDVQIPEPVEFCLHSAKQKIESTNKILDVKNIIGYHGVGESFRVGASTILGYKQTRLGALKPIHIDAITEYLVKKYKSIPCEGLEADDWCIISAIGKKDHVVASHDKDCLGCAVYSFNPTKPELGIQNGNCFGGLWLEEKINSKGKVEKTVRGIGRMFFYWQVCAQDTVDNYAAHSASQVKWGELSAYEALKDCKNDNEALAAVVGVYKHLYPAPSKVVGWRGDILSIDWNYVLSENWVMARMLRKPDENLTAEMVFCKLGLWKD